MCNVMEEYKTLLQNTIIRGNVTLEESIELQTPLVKLINSMRPKKLYRYRTCTELNFASLAKDELYFNIPKNFNDPHDCLSYVCQPDIQSLVENEMSSENMIKQLYDMRKSTHLIEDNFSPNILPTIKFVYSSIKKLNNKEFNLLLKKLKTKYIDYDLIKQEIVRLIEQNRVENIRISREQTFIACLSETIDSTLMWSHYTDYHKGFSLEYDTDEILAISNRCQICKDKCISQHILGLYPVIYGNERFNATEYEIETLKLRLSNYYYGLNVPFCIPDEWFYIKSNTYKSLEWKYEREWRLIYSCKMNHPSTKVEIIRPKAVYLGSQISDINNEIVKKLVDGKNIAVHEMYVDNNNSEYKLSYKTL